MRVQRITFALPVAVMLAFLPGASIDKAEQSALSMTGVQAAVTTTCSYPSPTWTTGLKNATGLARGPVTDFDAGKHECYDQLVVRRVAGETDSPVSYDARYVTSVTTDPTGCPVSMGTGVKIIRVWFDAPNNNDYGIATTSNKLGAARVGASCPHVATALRTWTDDIHVNSAPINVTGFNSIVSLKWLGSSEGRTSIAIGVKSTKPFRATMVNGGRDLALYVAK